MGKNKVIFLKRGEIMEWYDLLITNEFLDYFNNEGNAFYKAKNDGREYIPEPLFKKFADTVSGITYAFSRFTDYPELLLTMKEVEPEMHYAYINCKKLLPPVITLVDIWKSIDLKGHLTPYKIDVKTLNAQQIAVLILYPFWNRMGGSWEIEFLESGMLKRYLFELKAKSQILNG